MTIELTKEELQQVMICIDTTLKQGGLQVAVPLVALAAKFQQAGQQEDANSNP